jgi:hypothetical protein
MQSLVSPESKKATCREGLCSESSDPLVGGLGAPAQPRRLRIEVYESGDSDDRYVSSFCFCQAANCCCICCVIRLSQSALISGGASVLSNK